MTLQRERPKAPVSAIEQSVLIIAKSGLKVDTSDDIWVILPNKGKGYRLSMSWVRSSDISDGDRELILGVVIYYVRTKAAATAAGVVSNVKPFLVRGIPSFNTLRSIWSGLKTNNKKGLNQFFGTLFKQGNEQFQAYHAFTSSNLDRPKVHSLDPSSGALSAFEFDSLARRVNDNVREFDWAAQRDLDSYRSSTFFGRVRNLVTNKLLLSIVRRPIQIALLKWSDLIPAGASYHDGGIRVKDELRSLGGHTLQLRVYIAKSKGMLSPRECPERRPLHLSEDLSKIMRDYKEIFFKGLGMLLASNKLNVSKSDLLALMDDIPMFPDGNLFELKVSSLDEFKGLFTQQSTAFHISEASVATAMRLLKFDSDRTGKCIATSNRIRHTVLTRGAHDGLSAAHLAQITGVTGPAARHYIDLDYSARRLIDSNYVGNRFLKAAFSGTVTDAYEGEEVLLDGQFNPVGGVHSKRSCLGCASVSGRPLACYGCRNFRPILEANHRSVLADAEDKLALNRNALTNPLHTRSVEKLERQIAWVKLTIEVCEETLARRRGIDV